MYVRRKELPPACAQLYLHLYRYKSIRSLLHIWKYFAQSDDLRKPCDPVVNIDFFSFREAASPSRLYQYKCYCDVHTRRIAMCVSVS